MDNQHFVRTKGYFPNNSLGQEIINSVTHIFIQTWHRRLGYLRYQNIFCAPKVADGIDFKGQFQARYIVTVWNRGNKRNILMNWCYSLANNLMINIVILAAYILSLEGQIDFIFGFRIVQPGHIMLNQWKPKVRLLIYFKSSFIKQSASPEKKLNHLHTDFEREFANKALKEYTSKEVVKLEPSAPYTLEQNGKAEDLNYTLMSSVWCILADIHLPKML